MISLENVALGRGKHGTVGFANDAQFLMIAEDSTRDLQDKIIGRYLATEQKRMHSFSLCGCCGLGKFNRSVFPPSADRQGGSFVLSTQPCDQRHVHTV
jgi:hypothetical protein